MRTTTPRTWGGKKKGEEKDPKVKLRHRYQRLRKKVLNSRSLSGRKEREMRGKVFRHQYGLGAYNLKEERKAEKAKTRMVAAGAIP